MNLQSTFILFIGSSLLMLGCSVYKSNGRKSFETQAPSNIRASFNSTQMTLAEQEIKHDTCWSQPVKDPLWHVEAQSEMIVTQINQDEIQVCLQAL